MSIRFLFPLLDADGCRTFSFDHCNDHYRLVVLSYMVFFPFPFRSVLGFSAMMCTLPWLTVPVAFFSFFLRYCTPSRFRFTQIVCYGVGLYAVERTLLNRSVIPVNARISTLV